MGAEYERLGRSVRLEVEARIHASRRPSARYPSIFRNHRKLIALPPVLESFVKCDSITLQVSVGMGGTFHNSDQRAVHEQLRIPVTMKDF